MIPVIDLAPYLKKRPGAREAAAAELGRALQDIGFFVIVNHGIPQTLIDATFAEARRFHTQPMDAKPSELFRRQCFVSVEPEEEMAKHVIAEIGDDNLVVSTDWPHDDSRYPHALDTFLELSFSKESKRKILWDNTARLYKL